eukprot:547738-Amphidinium_carterae.1
MYYSCYSTAAGAFSWTMHPPLERNAASLLKGSSPFCYVIARLRHLNEDGPLALLCQVHLPAWAWALQGLLGQPQGCCHMKVRNAE